jgi:hypothetical protein
VLLDDGEQVAQQLTLEGVERVRRPSGLCGMG